MLIVREYTPADATWVLAQHIAHYTQVENFDASFGATVEGLLVHARRTDPNEAVTGWIAEFDGAQAGCIFLSRDGPGVARVHLLFVREDVRGTGVGQRLLETFEIHAATAGYTKCRLATFAEHAYACRLYLRNGYRLSDSFATEAFGRALTEQRWEKAIQAK